MAHFIIRGEKYPSPEKYTLGETAVIQEITGVNAGDIEAETGGNILLTIALMTIAVKRATPGMSFHQARAFVEGLDADAFDYVEDDADPPTTPEAPGTLS